RRMRTILVFAMAGDATEACPWCAGAAWLGRAGGSTACPWAMQWGRLIALAGGRAINRAGGGCVGSAHALGRTGPNYTDVILRGRFVEGQGFWVGYAAVGSRRRRFPNHAHTVR